MNNLLGNRQAGMSIYGDMNTQQATTTTDLNKISDGKNLETFTDTSVFNLNQILKLDNTIYDTRNNWFNVQSFTSGTAATIQGALDGWTPTDTMFLQVPVSVTLIQDLIVYNDEANSLLAGDFPVLNIFDIVRVFLGRNNIRVGRPSGELCTILKASLNDNEYTPAECDIYGQLGLPYTKMAEVPYTVTNVNNDEAPSTFYVNWENRWQKCALDILQQIGGALQVQPVTIELAIPMAAICSYFKVKQFLPPNFPIKLEMQFKQSPIPIGLFSFASTTTNYIRTGPFSWTPDLSQIKLFYRSHLLNSNVQQSINNEWVTKRFLTNYYTYEYQEYIGNGTNDFNVNVTISQQRPLEILLRIVPNTIDAEPIANGIFTTWALRDCVSPFHNYNYVYINIGGRNKVEYFNNYVTTNPQAGFKKCQEAMNASINARQYASKRDLASYKTVGQNMQANKNFTISTGTASYAYYLFRGFQQDFVINPGDMLDTNTMSTDQGAVSITMQFNITEFTPTVDPTTGQATFTTGNLSNKYKLLIIKKYPEQLALSQDLNVQLIQWPAVVSQPNQIFISNTFNNN
jgi:hypothetical protein